MILNAEQFYIINFLSKVKDSTLEDLAKANNTNVEEINKHLKDMIEKGLVIQTNNKVSMAK